MIEKEGIAFAKQLIEQIEKNVELLEKAKENNDPREFNEIKKKSFKLYEELGKLIK